MVHPSIHGQPPHTTLQRGPPHPSLTVENPDLLQTSSPSLYLRKLQECLYMPRNLLWSAPGAPHLVCSKGSLPVRWPGCCVEGEGGKSRETPSFLFGLGPRLRWRPNLEREDVVGLGHVEAVVTEMPRPWGVVPAPQGAPHDGVRGREDQEGCRGREAWAERGLRIQGADNNVRH